MPDRDFGSPKKTLIEILFSIRVFDTLV